LFHFALAPRGALFLGSSETTGEHSRLFTSVDRKWKLYFRAANDEVSVRPALADLVPPFFDGRERRGAPRFASPDDEPGALRRITEQALLSHYGQAGVLIDARGQIMHILGRTGKFLEPADGDAVMNILHMAREGLRRELTVALHKVVANKKPVAYSGLQVKENGGFIGANLTLRPVEFGDPDLRSRAYLVVLEEVPGREATGEGVSATEGDSGNRIATLEQELRSKDEYLQATLEEMQTTNEELKSTNEEMQSVNEELQSSNEEMETSKEELQSVNEELSTVNAELQDKVTELSRANNDMNNLLAGTGVGTLFVDHQLRIARFTPAITQVINLIATDVGRPLAHVAANVVGYDTLVEDIQTVLDTLLPKEAEVQVKSGNWFLMRIRPYRTMENTIEGAVVTMVDISERKKTEESLRGSQTRLSAFINQAYAGVGDTDLEGNLMFVNDHMCKMLGYKRDELLQLSVRDIIDPRELPDAVAQLDAVAHGGPDSQMNRQYLRKDRSRVRTLERVRALRDEAATPTSLLFILFDLSESD
jgi:two-component system CheB/CheR fusion protein